MLNVAPIAERETMRRTNCVRRWVLVCGFIAAAPSAAQVPPPPSASEPQVVILPAHMPEEVRTDIDKVVVISGRGAADQDVTGSYERDTPGLVGGIDAGRRMGTISREVGGVPVSVPIPGLALPGAILGGLTGATRRQIQEFRDALTEQISNAESPPLRSDGLAIDTFWGIRKRPQIDSNLYSATVEIEEDTDAVLYVAFDDLTINVDGADAIITTSAVATLRKHPEGNPLYETVVHYEDRDKLRSWTANDNALWRDYTNFARYYLGRELAADVFNRVQLGHELTVAASESTKLDRKAANTVVAETTLPTLAWTSELTSGAADTWARTVDASQIAYDLEIFDARQLVYDAEAITGSSHTLAYELEACQTYYWSIKPSYRVDGEVRYGDWMRFAPPEPKKKKRKKDDDAEVPHGPTKKGVFGRRASEAPAYIQDFARLIIDCP